MAITFVQAKTASEQVGGTALVMLDSTPTAGNLLVLWHSARSLNTPSVNGGWTAHPTGYVDGGVDRGAMFWKVSDGTETSIEATSTGDRHIATVIEFAGDGTFTLDTSAETTGSSDVITTGSVTPAGSAQVVVVGGAVINTSDAIRSVTPGSGWTEAADSMVEGGAEGGYHPLHWMGYQIVASASGAYNPTGTATQSADFGGQTMAFQSAAVPTSPVPGIWMDWGRDGFTDGATSGGTADPRLARMLPEAAAVGTAYGGDNVTDRVLRAEWWRGASYDHIGQPGPGGFTILLDNFDGLFDPDNTASPLYGYLTPGVPVWGGAIAATGAMSTANGTGTVAGFMAGYVKEFAPTVRDGQRVCEVIGEDALALYQRATVSIAPSLSRSHATFRSLILDGVGEDSSRRDLATESGMLPFSAVDAQNALAVLDELNRATATRHYVRPADSKEDWYDYVTVNKLHKLTAAADQTLDGDDIDDVSGWRVTNENVVEVQRATVEPIGLSPDNNAVWTYSDTPFSVPTIRPRIIYANFDDYVFDASVDVDFVTGSGTAGIANLGKSARIGIWATAANTSVGSVRILGQQVTRGDSETVVAGDESAGALAGPTIASDYIGQTAAAQGLVDFIVWKFGQPLKRPQLSLTGKNATTLSTIFSRDIFDVLTLSIDNLSVTSKRVEIIGLRGSVVPGRIFRLTYELQETPNQSAITSWFVVDTDSINGSQVLAPF